MKTEDVEMLGWTNGNWCTVPNDPRMVETEGDDYDKWMVANGYTNAQVFGCPDGYHYNLWAHKDRGLWIVSISDNNDFEDVLVKGFRNLADILSHLGAGAVSSVLDGGELGLMWAERATQREAMGTLQSIASRAMGAMAQKAQECECADCVANREKVQKSMN